MAYADRQRSSTQRLIVGGAVALLQGAAIIALVNGLAVHFVPGAPPPRLAGEQIRLDPPPPPPPPTDQPQARRSATDSRITAPPSRTDVLPPNTGVTVVPTGPVTVDPPVTIDPPVTVDPPQPPVAPPRLARPRNDPASWVGAGDYPLRDLDEGHQGAVRVRLVIGGDGRVRGCEVIASSGWPGLDRATCTAVSRRARFDPARDETGAAVTGHYTGTIRWVIPQ